MTTFETHVNRCTKCKRGKMYGAAGLCKTGDRLRQAGKAIVPRKAFFGGRAEVFTYPPVLNPPVLKEGQGLGNRHDFFYSFGTRVIRTEAEALLQRPKMEVWEGSHGITIECAPRFTLPTVEDVQAFRQLLERIEARIRRKEAKNPAAYLPVKRKADPR